MPCSLGQAIIDRLARQPSYSTSLKRCCAAARHSVSVFKQSPEHHDGRGSCLALLGSDGVAGGSLAIPQSLDLVVQPTSSRLSSSGATLGQFQLLSCTLSLLVRQSLAALFFSSGLGGGAPVALGYLKAVVGELATRRCGFASGGSRLRLSRSHANFLASTHQYQRDQPPAPSRYRAEPGHASAPPSSTQRPSSLSRRCGFCP